MLQENDLISRTAFICVESKISGLSTCFKCLKPYSPIQDLKLGGTYLCVKELQWLQWDCVLLFESTFRLAYLCDISSR